MVGAGGCWAGCRVRQWRGLRVATPGPWHMLCRGEGRVTGVRWAGRGHAGLLALLGREWPPLVHGARCAEVWGGRVTGVRTGDQGGTEAWGGREGIPNAVCQIRVCQRSAEERTRLRGAGDKGGKGGKGGKDGMG